MVDYPMPTGQEYPKHLLQSDFGWYEETGQRNESLAFKLLVPVEWHKDAVISTPELSTTTLVPLALFASDDGGCYLQIQAVRLDREISAEHWIRHFMLVSEYVPQCIVSQSHALADSECTFEIEGHAMRGRIVNRIHGDVMFMVFAFCEADPYPGLAEKFAVSVASFRPTMSTPRATIEDRTTATVSEIMEFGYPASWIARTHDPVQGRAAVDLTSINENVPTGLIRVKLTEKPTRGGLVQQFDDALDEFGEAGVTVTKRNERKDVPFDNKQFLNGSLQVFEGVTTVGLPQELWILVAETGTHYVTVGLLTPDRRKEFLIWAWNHRAFNIVSETLQSLHS